MIYSREEINQADSMEIVSILNSLGEPIRKVGQYYETKAHDSLRISGNKYYWNSRGTNGKTIKFIMEYYGYSFTKAVELILDKINQKATASTKSQMKSDALHEPSSQWSNDSLAEISEKRRAIAYLCKSRMISYEIVIELIKRGIIAQDTFGCVLFKALDENGEVVGAERRSMAVGSHFRQTVRGTNSLYGVNIPIGNPNSIFAFESSIDMISFYEIYHRKIRDSILVSLRGLKPRIIDSTCKRYNISGDRVYICVDNDESGNTFLERMKEKTPELNSIIIHDGCKDWNERLQKMKNGNKGDAFLQSTNFGI